MWSQGSAWGDKNVCAVQMVPRRQDFTDKTLVAQPLSFQGPPNYSKVKDQSISHIGPF